MTDPLRIRNEQGVQHTAQRNNDIEIQQSKVVIAGQLLRRIHTRGKGISPPVETGNRDSGVYISSSPGYQQIVALRLRKPHSSHRHPLNLSPCSVPHNPSSSGPCPSSTSSRSTTLYRSTPANPSNYSIFSLRPFGSNSTLNTPNFAIALQSPHSIIIHRGD